MKPVQMRTRLIIEGLIQQPSLEASAKQAQHACWLWLVSMCGLHRLTLESVFVCLWAVCLAQQLLVGLKVILPQSIHTPAGTARQGHT